MSGYGKPDEEQENAQAMVDNAIALARMMIPSGPSEARREAQPGCRYCVVCQVWHDKMPNLKVVTKML
jgi:hypothetical protein